MNFIELIQCQAMRVFGKKEKADAWMNQPKTAFGGISPLDYARTEARYREVNDALERISHGFSL